MKMKLIIAVCALSFAAVFSYAQTAAPAVKLPFAVKQGDKAFNMFDYNLAVQYYAKALKKAKGDTVYVQQKIADAYRLMNNPQMASVYYKKLANNSKANVKNKFYYGETLRQLGDYKTATQYFNEYKKANPADANVAEILKGLDNVAELNRNKAGYAIELLEFNTKYSDFGPAFFEGKDSIFYASNKVSKNAWNADKWSYNDYYQIYIGNVSGEANKTAIIKRKPNTKFHDGPAVYDASSNRLILTRSNYKCSLKTAKDKKTVNLKLFSMPFPYTKKPVLEGVPFNSDEYSVAHPALTKDAKILYFASDMPGGYGGTDLYMVNRTKDGWSAPINLGSDVNSKYDEKFPFIADDGVLYFSANALDGLGGLDVYKSKMVSGKWGKPENLGAPINSNFDDFSYIVNPATRKGYFTSNRPGGYGDDDIYRFTYKEEKKTMPLIVKVVDAETNEPIANANITVPCAENKITSLLADANGEGKFTIDEKSKCDASAEMTGYKANKQPVNKDVKDGVVIIPLTKTMVKLLVTVKEEGTNLPIRDVNIVLDNVTTGSQQTFTTSKDGLFSTLLVSGSTYAISSPDYASIAAPVNASETPDAQGIIHRDFVIPAGGRKLSVPLTANCFRPNSTIVLINEKGDKTTALVDEKGYVRLALTPNTNYRLEFDGKNEQFSTGNLNPGDEINLPCKFTVGETWILQNIYYDLDKYNIRTDAAKELDRLVKIMKDNPTLEIELGSHTDCRQTVKYNMTLSANRAKSAVAYIANKGINSKRLISAGYGEARLTNDCACEPTNESPCSDEQHQANRRTEVRVLKY